MTLFIGVALLASSALVVQADKYPPGPSYRNCPDSLKIIAIQQPDTTIAPCHPATGDSVYGVGGIISGFDAKPTGFAFYFQQKSPQAVPFSGIDVFTGGSNLAASLNLAIGDSVFVYGATAEFGGGTEILSFNNSFTSPDIVVRKVSSGHGEPPFFQGTVAQLQELPTNAFAEQWEGVLVRVTTTMRVARNSNTPGLGTGNSFILVDQNLCGGGPCDSLFVDGNTLTTYAPPPVGTLVSNVQGIYEQRARGYRIQLRDGNDVTVQTPPNLTDAYSVHDDTIRVVFDRDVELASSQNVANYSLASFGNILSATRFGGSAVHLALDPGNGLPDGTAETVTVSGVKDAAFGLPITTPQQSSFANGVMDIGQIQAADPLFLGAPCDDRSAFAGPGSGFGTRLTYRGVVTAAFGNVYYQQDNSASRGGIAAFAPIVPLVEGRQYMWVGRVQEFFNETEAVDNVYLRDEGVAALPAALLRTVKALGDSACDSGQVNETGEDYEGMLVKVQRVRVVNEVGPAAGFRIGGPCCTFPDTMNVTLSSTYPFTFDADSLHTLDVTGILRFTFGLFRIAPRTDADIFDYGLNASAENVFPARVQLSVFPNPATRANVSFGLPRGVNVDLAVFDLAGRKVATLAKGSFAAGTYSRTWNGLTERGDRVGAGVYFIRLKAGDEVYTNRSVLID
jgi:predicted extracellular nuclease